MTKNLKGGYKIVSLKGNDLTSESAFTVKGLYEDLADSYSKPILVSEIVIDGVKEQDAYAVVKKTESGYTIEVYDYALTVTDEDAVTSEAIVKGITSIDGYEGEVTLGENLTLSEDGELSASGGGGSTLYCHSILFNSFASGKKYACYLLIITDSSTKFTSISDVNTYVRNHKTYNADSQVTIQCSGGYKNSDDEGQLLGVDLGVTTITNINMYAFSHTNGGTTSLTYATSDISQFVDNVYTIGE